MMKLQPYTPLLLVAFALITSCSHVSANKVWIYNDSNIEIVHAEVFYRDPTVPLGMDNLKTVKRIGALAHEATLSKPPSEFRHNEDHTTEIDWIIIEGILVYTCSPETRGRDILIRICNQDLHKSEDGPYGFDVDSFISIPSVHGIASGYNTSSYTFKDNSNSLVISSLGYVGDDAPNKKQFDYDEAEDKLFSVRLKTQKAKRAWHEALIAQIKEASQKALDGEVYRKNLTIHD